MNTSSSSRNNNNLDEIEETMVTISVTEEGDVEQRQMEDDDQRSELTIGVVDDEQKLEIVGGSGTIRRSVSLNDYEACRVRADVRDNNNNYYSARHEVQIRSVDGNFGFESVKVDQIADNQVQ